MAVSQMVPICDKKRVKKTFGGTAFPLISFDRLKKHFPLKMPLPESSANQKSIKYQASPRSALIIFSSHFPHIFLVISRNLCCSCVVAGVFSPFFHRLSETKAEARNTTQIGQRTRLLRRSLYLLMNKPAKKSTTAPRKEETSLFYCVVSS